MRKVGIYGGSFDPIHSGHLAFARAAVRQLELSELLLIPAADSPFKQGKMQAPARDRLEMCRLAVQDDPAIHVSDIEIARGGVSYTYDTVKALAKPGEMLYLLAGSDIFGTVNRWKYGILIVQNVIVVGGWRGEGEKAQLEKDADHLRACGCGVELVRFEPVDISSTALREKIRSGADTGEYLPQAVKKYIDEQGLYRD